MRRRLGGMTDVPVGAPSGAAVAADAGEEARQWQPDLGVSASGSGYGNSYCPEVGTSSEDIDKRPRMRTRMHSRTVSLRIQIECCCVCIYNPEICCDDQSAKPPVLTIDIVSATFVSLLICIPCQCWLSNVSSHWSLFSVFKNSSCQKQFDNN